MTVLPTALLALSLAGSSQAQAGKFRLAWIDVVSEDTGTWLNYDVPMLGSNPGTVGMRFLYQAQLVWQLPIDNLYVGTSLQSQTLHYERTMKFDIGPGDVGWYAGAHTRLFMPSGAMAGLRWKTTRTRLAVGASAVTPSTWRKPGYSTWSVLPTLGFSIVLGKPEPSTRFEAQPIQRIERPEEPVEGEAVEGSPLPEGETAEGTEPTALPEGETAEGTEPSALPEGETAEGEAAEGEAAEGEAAAPGEVILPESEVETTAPTGPTEVQFSAPQQVVIPGSEPTQVEIAEPDEDQEPAPTQVILPGDDDDSSQSDDK